MAVRSAEHNSELNGTADQDGHSPFQPSGRREDRGRSYDRDITADILSALSESIPENLKEGGTHILSGIIESKLAQVVAAYESKGLALQKQLRRASGSP